MWSVHSRTKAPRARHSRGSLNVAAEMTRTVCGCKSPEQTYCWHVCIQVISEQQNRSTVSAAKPQRNLCAGRSCTYNTFRRKASTPERRKSHFTSLQLLHSSGPCTNPEEMCLETLLGKDGNPRTSHFPISTVEDISSQGPLPCMEVSPAQNPSAVHTCAKSQGQYSFPDCRPSYSSLYTMESRVQVTGFCSCLSY